MCGDVIGTVALDRILRIVRRRVVGIALVVKVACMNRNDRSRNPARFGIPANVVTDIETLSHVDLLLPPYHKRQHQVSRAFVQA